MYILLQQKQVNELKNITLAPLYGSLSPPTMYLKKRCKETAMTANVFSALDV